eukprot:PITA_03576
MQNLRQRVMTIKEYIKELYKVNLRVGYVEYTPEKTTRYLNGLWMEIVDEINILSPKTIEEAYQRALKVEENITKKQNTRRGRGSDRGKGQSFGRGKTTNNSEEGSSSKTLGQTEREGSTRGGRPYQHGRGNGRGRGNAYQCYKCQKWGHKSFECLEGEHVGQRGAYVTQPNVAEAPPQEVENVPETGRRSTDNLVATEMVEKLGLKKLKHPTPYKVSWLQKGRRLLVDEQCEVEFHIGKYKDKVTCDIMPMDVCHILLGRPWQYDRKVVHDGEKNCYKFVKDGIKHMRVPMKEENVAETSRSKTLLIGGKEFLRQVEENEVKYAVVRKLRVILLHAEVIDLPVEIQDMLQEFSDIVVDDLPDELPPKQGISHHIDFIQGASFPNKAAYLMSPKDNEEIRKQVQELLDKGLVRESLSPCVVPTVLIPKKGGEWQMCTDSRVTNKTTIRYRFPLPRMEDTMDCLSGVEYFSKIDMKSDFFPPDQD